MNRIRPAAVAVILLVAAPLAACTPQTTAAPELPAQDMTRWVMPLDEFWSPAARALPNYAENLLIADCLGEEGIDWPIPWQPTDDADYLIPGANASGFLNLTVDLARAQGYRVETQHGRAVQQQDAVATLTKLNGIAASTPGFEPLFEACLKEARPRAMQIEINGDGGRLQGWIAESINAAADAPEVTTADAAWRECLRESGYPVEAVSPSEFWRDEIERLGVPPLQSSAADGAPVNPLSPEEIDLAVADATCRESSGWSEAMYQAMWDAQVVLVSEHADDLVRIRDRWEKAREEILKIIAEHAPKR